MRESRLFYMAPAQNAPLIAAFGILSYNRVHALPQLEQLSASIADPFVNSRRHGRQIDGRSLHEYVPLYWATHTPMQYVVTVKERRLPQSDLIFLVVDAEKVLELPGVLSTDGNAASGDTQFFKGAGALPHLDWQILRTPNCWSKEWKRRKCAELLVPDQVPAELILKVCTYDDGSAATLRGTLRELDDKLRGNPDLEFVVPKIRAEPRFYYQVG